VSQTKYHCLKGKAFSYGAERWTSKMKPAAAMLSVKAPGNCCCPPFSWLPVHAGRPWHYGILASLCRHTAFLWVSVSWECILLVRTLGMLD
jgi:hypothetical protein